MEISEQFIAGSQEMRELWQGKTVLRAAREVSELAPAGTVTFVSTSTEGSALAAVCAALRGDGSGWRRINLLTPSPELAGPVVFVEPVFPGRAWGDAVERRYPRAMIAVPTRVRDYTRSAANAAAAA